MTPKASVSQIQRHKVIHSLTIGGTTIYKAQIISKSVSIIQPLLLQMRVGTKPRKYNKRQASEAQLSTTHKVFTSPLYLDKQALPHLPAISRRRSNLTSTISSPLIINHSFSVKCKFRMGCKIRVTIKMWKLSNKFTRC